LVRRGNVCDHLAATPVAAGDPMHIGIPFDIETIKQSWGQTARVWGRVMGNQTFLRALAAADGCTRLTLFVPSRQDVEILGRTLLDSFGPHRAKVTAVPFAKLAEHLATAPLDLLHMLDPNLWFGAHIRTLLARRPFPVTGVTHSLANQHFLEWALLNNANGVRPEDCLVCSTPTAELVIQSVFRRLKASQPGFKAPCTTVIPFGVNVAHFAGSAKESRQALGFPPEQFVALSLGRFNPLFKMDLRPLLRLAALTGQKLQRPFRLILAGSSGDGDYVRFMQDQARQEGVADLVDFVLDPDETRKCHLLRAADAFVSLSDNIQETFGLTPIEAMAAGTPAVVSDWDGYRALVEDGISGFLVPTRTLAPDPAWEALLALRYDSLVHLFGAQTTAVDLEAASQCLVRLAEDPDLRQRMGAAAVKRAALFDWPVVMDQYLSLWQRLVADFRPDAPSADPATPRSSALHFLADFASYATAPLKPTDRFRATPAGTALQKGGASTLLYFETDEFLDRSLLVAILERCAAPRTVAQLTELLSGPDGRPGLQVGQNVLWLYKYGYLRYCTPGAGAS